MKNLFCPKINENDVKIRGKTQKSTFLTQKQMSVPGSRLESMVLMGMDLPLGAVQRQIASGIDIIVHLGRLRDKSRKVLEVSEILDYQDGEILVSPLYRFEETGEKDGKIQGTWRKMDDLVHTQKLLAAGYKEV